jgi:hypothetical protein
VATSFQILNYHSWIPHLDSYDISYAAETASLNNLRGVFSFIQFSLYFSELQGYRTKYKILPMFICFSHFITYNSNWKRELVCCTVMYTLFHKLTTTWRYITCEHPQRILNNKVQYVCNTQTVRNGWNFEDFLCGRNAHYSLPTRQDVGDSENRNRSEKEHILQVCCFQFFISQCPWFSSMLHQS